MTKTSATTLATSHAKERVIEVSFSEPYEETKLPWVLLAIMLVAFASSIGLVELGKMLGNLQLVQFAWSILDFGLLDKRIFDGEVWRLLTTPFLHVNSMHILNNGASFMLACLCLRTIYAGRAWLWIFMGSNIMGAIMSVSINMHEQAVGASIALAGMLGAMLTSELLRLKEKLPRYEYPAMMVVSLKGLMMFLVFQTVVENLLPNVGHYAHLCGLGIGFLLGFLFARNGKTLVVTGAPHKVRAIYPAAVKQRIYAPSYTHVELDLQDNFDVSTEYLGFINVTRGGLFYRKPRVRTICGPLTQEIADAGSYSILGTQYPPKAEAEALDSAYKKQAQVDRIKNLPWTISGIILGVVGGYYIYNAWFFAIVLDVKDYGWIQSLPDWIEPIAKQGLSHAGAAIMSFITAHTLVYVALELLQWALRRRTSGSTAPTTD